MRCPVRAPDEFGGAPNNCRRHRHEGVYKRSQAREALSSNVALSIVCLWNSHPLTDIILIVSCRQRIIFVYCSLVASHRSSDHELSLYSHRTSRFTLLMFPHMSSVLSTLQLYCPLSLLCTGEMYSVAFSVLLTLKRGNSGFTEGFLGGANFLAMVSDVLRSTHSISSSVWPSKS